MAVAAARQEDIEIVPMGGVTSPVFSNVARKLVKKVSQVARGLATVF